MSYFSDLGLAEPILRALAAKGYTDPTPIQRQAIPALLEGRDLLGIAQTGTGKTAAFALPSLHRLAADPSRARRAACRMLVLSPTRELAAQIAENMRGYAKYLYARRRMRVRRRARRQAGAALVPGCDVLVATPGRLLDLIDQRALTLRHVEIFVLDEADQMMDLGFIVPLKRVAEHAARKSGRACSSRRRCPRRSPSSAAVHQQSGPRRGGPAGHHRRARRAVRDPRQPAEKQALLTLRLREGLRFERRSIARWCSPAPSTAPTASCAISTPPAYGRRDPRQQEPGPAHRRASALPPGHAAGARRHRHRRARHRRSRRQPCVQLRDAQRARAVCPPHRPHRARRRRRHRRSASSRPTRSPTCATSSG